MLAKVQSYGITGLEVYPVNIEVDVSQGLPATSIVGLPDSAVRESRERVRSAIRNSGYTYPENRTTINLSPADIKKEGPSFDLAIAIGILAATGQIDRSLVKSHIILGELALDGNVQPIKGALPIALSSHGDCKGLILPLVNCHEAAIMEDTPVFPVNTLRETINLIQDPDSLRAFHKTSINTSTHATLEPNIDFSDVKGQLHVKRGLEIAAAGGHNCILVGPPGSGKTMLAKRIATILPEMSKEESLETTKIHSIMGLIPYGTGLITSRPFRAPHHTSSDISLIGGGSIPKPGEITLAHNGVLYLDELPEFNRNVLESLRQPLEDHCVTVCRASKTSYFQASFMLVASMNPCMCGNLGNPRVMCRCSSTQIQRYRSKISGPLLDRIDIHLDVPSLNYLEMSDTAASESSAAIKERVTSARKVQLKRFSGQNKFFTFGARNKNGYNTFSNARMSHKQMRKYCELGEDENALLKAAMKELNFSARAHDKILKVARTIADLACSDVIYTEHLAEAIQYRSLDRNLLG